MNPSVGEQKKEEEGYDVRFIGEVSESLKCIVCHLVMRKPIQIMTCGHRFCKACFERFKCYNDNLETPLCCPVDREPIDVSKIFDDNGIARDIGNLQVRCSQDECSWVDDLRHYEKHEAECRFKVKEVVVPCRTLNELYQRITKCEESSLEKEKDIAYLKYHFAELKKSFTEKGSEVDVLKEKNSKLEEEIVSLTERYKESKKQLERDFENTLLKYQLLERRIEAGENLASQAKTVLQEQQAEIKLVRDNVNDAIVNIDPSSETSSMKNLEEKITNSIAEMKETESKFEKLFTERAREYDNLNEKINNVEEQLTFKCSTMEDKMNEAGKKLDKEISDMRVDKIEGDFKLNDRINTLSQQSSEVIINWRLQNVQEHVDSGKPVWSPVFYTTKMEGFSFKLNIEFSKDKKYIGLYLYTCYGAYNDWEQSPFNLDFQFQLIGKEGVVIESSDDLTVIESSDDLTEKELKEMRTALTIPPHKKCSTAGRGYSKFMNLANRDDYIIDNMILIKCILRRQDNF